ncbi:MAG: helix-turn-helix transcriptional regulator [Sulfurovum sp.]|nr:helix-turn-helix transcriptional regulator [Sulfurovum sp.]
MHRLEVLEKVKKRKEALGLTQDNISKLSQLGNRTVARFFSGEDVKLSTLEKITNIMGLDFAGTELVDVETLRDNRAKEKAIYIVSLVQDTSALEMQGLKSEAIQTLIRDTKEQFLTGEYRKNLWAS